MIACGSQRSRVLEQLHYGVQMVLRLGAGFVFGLSPGRCTDQCQCGKGTYSVFATWTQTSIAI